MCAPPSHQGSDHVAERGEREVNLGSFLESITLSVGLGLTLRALWKKKEKDVYSTKLQGSYVVTTIILCVS